MEKSKKKYKQSEIDSELVCEDDYIIIKENNINDILYSGDSETELVRTKQIKSNNIENKAEEEWNRKTKQNRNVKSYLFPNPHLRHLNLNNIHNITSLPVLKNGSRANDLKSCNITGFGKVVLSNTCAFDTLCSIFMVSYCDSKLYVEEIKQLDNENEFIHFISSIIQNGINASTYKNRAKIVFHNMNPEINEMEHNTAFVSCHYTISKIIKILCADIPTAIDYTCCSNSVCKNRNANCIYNMPYN